MDESNSINQNYPLSLLLYCKFPCQFVLYRVYQSHWNWIV